MSDLPEGPLCMDPEATMLDGWCHHPRFKHPVGEPRPCKDCGYPDGTFACKIRHISVNVENLRRDH